MVYLLLCLFVLFCAGLLQCLLRPDEKTEHAEAPAISGSLGRRS